MQAVLQIVHGTPAWVYVFFVYVLRRGVNALRERTMPLWRALIVPAIFIGIGLIRLIGTPGREAWSLLPWAGGAVLGAGLAALRPPALLAADRSTGLLTQAGSSVPLLRNVLNFGLQYAAAVVAARSLGEDQPLSALAHALSCASAGYFMVWAALLVRRYRLVAEQSAGSMAPS